MSDLERGLENPTVITLFELAQRLDTTPVALITPDEEAIRETGKANGLRTK
ncbi:XRE family transcriptional regulator [Tistrella mobilis KA081020-065]|uniref:XRE family transcriptional regulator n=1 Tax=Tistrella mobilis (strain KA081020-065) TaxID=1110502 RepID=I3TMQ8_TISMK|nr:XRE family transcriptional regulator [Tistrella mobilis KA081020-065]